MLVVVFEALDFVLKHLSNVAEFRVPQYVYSFGYRAHRLLGNCSAYLSYGTYEIAQNEVFP